jgi:hypothetical protein
VARGSCVFQEPVLISVLDDVSNLQISRSFRNPDSESALIKTNIT